MAKGEIAALLGYFAFGGYPFEHLVGRIRQTDEKVQTGNLGKFERTDVIDPDVGNLRQERLNRLEYGGEYATFAHTLFP